MSGVSLRFADSAISNPLDGTESRITLARVLDGYPNSEKKTALLAVTFTPTNGGKERRELYPLGKGGDFLMPNAEGTEFIQRVEKGTAKPGRDSSMMKFLQSLVAAGFNEELITNDVRAIEDTVVFTRVVAQPKFGNDPAAKEKQLVLVDKVISMPGVKVEKKVAPKTEKKTPTPKVTPAVAAAVAAPAVVAAPAAVAAPVVETALDDDALGQTIEFVSAALNAAPDYTVPRNRIQTAVFAALTAAKVPGAQRTKFMAEMNKADFFTADGRPWMIADGQVVGFGPMEAAA